MISSRFSLTASKDIYGQQKPKSKDALNFAAKDILPKTGKDKTFGSTAIKRPSLIFKQGDVADAMFYIQDDNVKVTVPSRRGKRAVLAILRQATFLASSVSRGGLSGCPSPRQFTTPRLPESREKP
jgi:hypothetical protein